MPISAGPMRTARRSSCVGCAGFRTICLVRYLQERTAVVESRCVVPCTASNPCPAGQFCDDGECAMPCDLDAGECPVGMFCAAALSRKTLARCWPESPIQP